MAIYKCCWNCTNGFRICTKPKEEMERINASKRLCEATYPVSNRLENPFKRRYCSQFEPDYASVKGHMVTKDEAPSLEKMTPDELLEYWRKSNEQS